VATFYVENFGCRATQADGAALERQFRDRGLEPAQAASQAQIVVLNTCTVTAAADQDARAAVRRIRHQNPDCQIIVTGCYAQRAPQEVAALPGVSQVIGNSHKHRLVELTIPSDKVAAWNTVHSGMGFVPVSALTSETPGALDSQELTTHDHGPILVSDIFAHTELLAAPVFNASHDRTRPNLKVQDGCDNRCSFCIIPYVRGQSRSLPLAEILRQVESLVATGYREVVISGINLGAWGRDLAGGGQRLRLADLIAAILEHTSLEKLRVSSVELMDWSDELIRLMADSPRVAKHAHVPLQSGSDRVLRKMHRRYRPWHYRERIEKIRAAMPMAAIGADVMTGFPGETSEEFESTRRLIEELPFTYLHVFTYSARPGTPAASMRPQVPAQVARERNRVLRELAAQKRLAFMRSFAGKQVEAITLNASNSSSTQCLTDNYLKLRVSGKHEANRWIKAQVGDVKDGMLFGTRST